MDAYSVLTELPGTSERLFGVAIGIVTNNKDPDGIGRVKVALPWMSEEVESDWARVVAPMAGSGRGVYFLPEVNDEVLVAFEHGNPDMPYVLGGLWNGQDKPPASNSNGENDVRTIKSRSGSEIRLTDTQNDSKIEIIDSSGHNTIVIHTQDNSITITSDGDVTISADKGKLKLSAQSVEISATTTVKAEANEGMDLKASGQLTIKGSAVNIN
jgi:phage baseplate assembly protein V